jgi:pyruvate formate lyase activating enzyme
VAEGTIFDIQHYAVHDGPGIRTLVFFKGCPLTCQWCCNPESQMFREQLRYVAFKCKACFTCINTCNKSAVKKEVDQICIDFSVCKNCNEKPCVESCNYDALSVTGKKYEAQELVNIIAKDIAFYRNSGGGVTFSGGEPFSQHEFLEDVIKKCKKLGIHIAVETCGWTDIENIKKVIEDVDLFLFDLKLMNNKLHIQYTGQSNKVILKNLDFISRSGKELIVRLPLVSGITDSSENINEIVQLLKKLKINKINIAPYHTLGVEKYKEVGLGYSLNHINDYPMDKVEEIQKFFIGEGLQCEIA